jgi:hypothetical protein
MLTMFDPLERPRVGRAPRGVPERMSDTNGEVSEVSGMGGQPDEISPQDAVAGAPEGQSGDADEGTAGPDAPPNEGRPGTEPPSDRDLGDRED